MDWPGLLQWSLKHQTASSGDKDVEPMSEADKAWLRDALEDFRTDAVEEMKKRLEQVKAFEKTAENYEDCMLEGLDLLLDDVQGVEMASNFARIGGLSLLFRLVKDEEELLEVRRGAFLILSEMSRNNPFVQDRCLQFHPFELINVLLGANGLNLEKQIVGFFAALLKGQNLKTKRLFTDIGGIEFLLQRAAEISSSQDKLRVRGSLAKILSIFVDYLQYDKQLGSPEDLLEPLADKVLKNKVSTHISLDQEAQEENKASAENPENKAYEDIGKRMLAEHGALDLLGVIIRDEVLTKEKEVEAVVTIFKNVAIYGKVNKVGVEKVEEHLEAAGVLAERLEAMAVEAGSEGEGLKKLGASMRLVQAMLRK